MRVLFMVSNANCSGGTEILALNIISALDQQGVESFLFSRHYYEGNDKRTFSLSKKEYKIYCEIWNSPIDKLLGGRISNYYIRKRLSNFVKKKNIDWVVNHAHDMIAMIPKSTKSAQVFNWSIEGYENTIFSEINKRNGIKRFVSLIASKNSTNMWHKLYSKIDKLILLTSNAVDEILRYNSNIKESQICIIPDPLMQKEYSKNHSSLSTGSVAYVGRLSAEKGVMRLLRIWEVVSKKLPNYKLNIYGDGYMKSDMQQYIANKQLENIEFKGFCRNLEDIYTKNDLCLMTSDTEGFGMVLIEAMYYGVPCITFDCPVSPKEIIADAGIAVPCFDEERYAQEVIKLLCEPERMKALQKRAIERAKDYYIDKVTALWMAMFNQK